MNQPVARVEHRETRGRSIRLTQSRISLRSIRATLAGVMDIVDYAPGLTPQAYGRIVHGAFAAAVRLQGISGIGYQDVETTFGGSYYGAKGSVRTDVILRNDSGDVIAIYDVKTGDAKIEPARAAQLRAKAQIGTNVPIIEMHISRGVSRKAAYATSSQIQVAYRKVLNDQFFRC